MLAKLAPLPAIQNLDQMSLQLLTHNVVPSGWRAVLRLVEVSWWEEERSGMAPKGTGSLGSAHLAFLLTDPK